jgi:ribose transport system permease protein
MSQSARVLTRRCILAALLITGGVDEREVPFKLITTIGTGRAFNNQVPWLVLIAFAVAIVFGILLAATRFGRYTYAVGSNEEAARRAGVPVDRHLIKVYALAGTLAGLAGFLSLARFSTTTIGGHDTDNLQAIAAAVIGGTSLFGGRGEVRNALIGAALIATIANGMNTLGYENAIIYIVTGSILLFAVTFDTIVRRIQIRSGR